MVVVAFLKKSIGVFYWRKLQQWQHFPAPPSTLSDSLSLPLFSKHFNFGDPSSFFHPSVSCISWIRLVFLQKKEEKFCVCAFFIFSRSPSPFFPLFSSFVPGVLVASYWKVVVYIRTYPWSSLASSIKPIFLLRDPLLWYFVDSVMKGRNSSG